MTKKDYSNWTKEELIKELEKFKKQKKYGIVWEDKPEKVALMCKEKLPVLTEIKDKEIITDPNKPTNILIEGDNYHALYVLNYTHKGKIDVIYIDPPYNTGNDNFRYNDKIVDPEDSFRHSKWLSFMDKRLRMAKNLLKDSGVILVQIDDNEFAPLRLLMDEIFGIENYRNTIVWAYRTGGAPRSKEIFAKKHDYILIYSKTKEFFFNRFKEKIKYEKDFFGAKKDENGNFYAAVNLRDVIEGEIELLKEDGSLYKRINVKPVLNLSKERVLNFRSQKPIGLIQFFLELFTKKDSIILDFFAGSGTTGLAVLKLNKEDGGNRKFILVTNNENNICTDVCYPRIEKVIKGYKNLKGEWVEGLGGNLKYFKTDFVDAKPTNENKKKLVDESTEMLCLKEDCFDFTHVDRDILGNLYEKYSPSNERKRLGEFYTPVEVVDYILTSVGYTYNNEIENKDLLDPACGSGRFLVRATRRLISRFLMKFGKANKKELRDPKNWKELVNRLSPDEAKIILEAVQEHIYGFDINPFACHIAEMNMLFQVIDLYQKVREKYPDYKLKRFKIYRTDSLEKPMQKQLFDWTHKAFLEEQEEIDAIKNKKFDFVVENPPYVRKERIPKLEKEKLSKNYPEIYHGDNDYYVYFLYASIKWLKDTGKFGVIVSSKFTKTRYGKYIRAFIVENTHISKFIDLRGSKVFANVTVDPCILILDKEKSNEIRVIKVKKDFEEESWEKKLNKLIWHIFKNGTKDYQDEYIKSFTVDQSSLIKTIHQENGKKECIEWKVVSKDISEIFEKIKNSGKYLLKDVADIYSGIKTGRDDIYRVTSEQINKYKLERRILRPVIEGKDIKKYQIIRKNLFLIFPEGIKIEDFPNTKNYLEQFKQDLENRTDIKNTNKKWYEFRPCNYYRIFDMEKIVVPDISTNNNFALDQEKSLCLMTCFEIVPKKAHNIKLILGILNSKLIEYYFKQISAYLGKKGYRYRKIYLEQLPIKLPETPEEKKIAEQIIKKVDEILELHKKVIIDIDAILEGEETEKLYNLPKVTFNIKDDAKFEKIKVENDRIFISLQDFIEIKDRLVRDFLIIYLNNNKEKLARIKDIKKFILNISVPKSDEVLKEISKKGMTNQEEIKNKIKQLEKEIDELVYKLYGITDEEKKIIEEFLK